MEYFQEFMFIIFLKDFSQKKRHLHILNGLYGKIQYTMYSDCNLDRTIFFVKSLPYSGPENEPRTFNKLTSKNCNTIALGKSKDQGFDSRP